MKWQKGLFVLVVLALMKTPVMAAGLTVLKPGGIGDEKIAGGVEFSAYEIGNRWDMSEPTDVITSESANLSNETFANGICLFFDFLIL